MPIHVPPKLAESLERFGQTHVLRFWSELSDAQRTSLLEQLMAIDWEQLDRLVHQHHTSVDWGLLADRATPPPAVRLSDDAPRWSRAEALDAAEQALRAGLVGTILVAGGQGTRLGFPHPKGMYPLGPVSGRSLFQMHVDQIVEASRRYGVSIPLYLMTSPATHDETVAYFAAHDRFGLPEEDLRIFCQGVMPAVDQQGRVLLEDRATLALSPDGHGGMLAAWQRSGGLEDAQSRGLQSLFYFQVDNPMVTIPDRRLLGYHRLAQSEMSTLVVAKQAPADKVGNVVSIDGRLQIIEYSDLPLASAERRDQEGRLMFWAGSIAVHVLELEFLSRVVESTMGLPFHYALKKVAYVDAEGRRIEPNEPNATKLERFIFDLMPEAQNALVVEGAAEDVFAPLKNASSASQDTPETSRAALVERARRWLRQVGIEVAPEVLVEISPQWAWEAEDVLTHRSRLTSPLQVNTFLDR